MSTSMSNRFNQSTPWLQSEYDEILQLELCLPSIEKENFFLEIRGNKLHVQAKRTPPPNARRIHKERLKSEYSCGHPLNANIDSDKIKAKLEKGLLTVILPRKNTDRKIDIWSAN